MADFTPEISPELIAAIRDANEDVAGAFTRALDAEFEIEVDEAMQITTTEMNTAAPAAEWRGRGLAVALKVGESGAVFWLPEASGLLPDWYAKPDLTGTSKLATLAQELGIVLLSEALAPTETEARHVAALADRIPSGEPAETLALVPITLRCGDKSGTAQLIWPLANPMAIFSADEPVDAPAGADRTAEAVDEVSEPAAAEPTTAADQATPAEPAARRTPYADLDEGIRQLPSYAKSLLKVKVPVTVTLAVTKQSVDEILGLGPGAILQFDKRCDGNLQLEIGDQQIAEGEAVKVGDKFGLWITAMTMPEERFWVANGQRSGTRVQ